MPPKKPAKPTVADVVNAVDSFAPFRLAESWDNVGLQIGDPGAPAGRIFVGLEVTREFLKEARAARANTLVTHHPLLFRPPKSLVENDIVGSLVAEVIRGGMALIAAHTNFDAVALGPNGVLADLIGMQGGGRSYLEPIPTQQGDVKYVVFVPLSHVEPVINAMAAAEAAVIGDYSHCTFRTEGTGTYKPLEGATPWAGSVGKLEQAEEVRLECVCPRHRLGALMREVGRAHPYEEVAFDVFPLEPVGRPVAGFGLVGNLPRKTKISALITRLKKELGLQSVGLVGDAGRSVERIAVYTGSGGDVVRTWRGEADLLITGEMNHHDCAEAAHKGVQVLLVGHWASEAIAAPRMADLIRAELKNAGFATADVKAARKEKNPLKRL